MSENTEVKELSKKRAYQLKIGGNEITAMKLEGFKATQLGGTLSPTNVALGGSRVEGDDWLVVVKDRNDIVMPYDVWVKQVSSAITNVSGSNVGTVSVVSSEPPYKTKIVKNIDELARALEEGWTEPYQFISGQWILKKPR